MPEAYLIAHLLHEVTWLAELHRLVRDVFVHFFGAQITGPRLWPAALPTIWFLHEMREA